MMDAITTNLVIALIALLFERFIGYPQALYKIISHPVVWIGGLISLFDKVFNRSRFSQDTRRINGAITLLAVVFMTMTATVLIAQFLRLFPGGILIEALLATSMLAQKSLHTHVSSVEKGLAQNLEAGRAAVRLIVGRDPDALDESEISKAAIESLAENTADGVIAPLFYMALFGFAGAAVYKAVNTADSMIGHFSDKYRAFGWAAAKLDDGLNYPPARLTGLLFMLTAFTSRKWKAHSAASTMRRDAKNHVSPNAGWPEAAMAGALDLTLGGPRLYQGRTVDLATMGNGRPVLVRHDIAQALKLYRRTLSLCAFLLMVTVLLFLMLDI